MISFLQLLALLAMFQWALPNEIPYLQIYDISDISQVVPDYSYVPDLDLASSLRHQNPLRERDNITSRFGKNEQEIINIITETIEPDSWNDGTASIRLWNHKLLVTAPARIHSQIK